MMFHDLLTNALTDQLRLLQEFGILFLRRMN